MGKLIRCMVMCFLFSASVWLGVLITDHEKLTDQLIRFHIVANSDSQADQSIKMNVRDAVLMGIQEDLKNVSNIHEARRYLQENIPRIEMIANRVLQEAGFDKNAVVTLCKEAFDTRYYDTFSLPAGIYETLRITIGDGLGKNWWCVTFPALCLPATSEQFRDAAVSAGFSNELSDTLSQTEQYKIRFYFLDVLGHFENILFLG